MHYTSGFRARMIQRLSGPYAVSASQLCQETGVPQQTLSRWLRDAVTVAPMTNDDRDNTPAARGPKQWTPEQKLKLVLAAAELDEQQRGELLRREGVHSAQLEEWRRAALEALAPQKRSPHKTLESRKIRELEIDLDRKNRALAEVTALLALQKKVQAIWGDGDENTAPKNGT